MTIRMLAWSVLLGLAHVLIAAGLMTRQRGLKWNTGNRDSDPAPLTGVAARAARASANFLETFGFFAAAALAVAATHRDTPHAAFGAQVYFWARRLSAHLLGGHPLPSHGGVGHIAVGDAAGSRGAALGVGRTRRMPIHRRYRAIPGRPGRRLTGPGDSGAGPGDSRRRATPGPVSLPRAGSR